MFIQLAAPEGFRADFTDEIAEGLVLCLSDVDPSNFIINDEGEVIAIDFGCTGFMPVSFVAHSLTHWKDFTRKVARFVTYPKPARLSKNLTAMNRAAGLLAMTGDNVAGECLSSNLAWHVPQLDFLQALERGVPLARQTSCVLIITP